MQVKSFLVTLTASLILLTLGTWNEIALASPINIENRHLELSKTAKFFPKDSSLTIHSNLNLKEISKYAEDVASADKTKEISEQSKNLMAGLFALTGLDFDLELAPWIDPQISLALFESPENEESFRWAMTLSSSDQNSGKQFLESLWQKKSLVGTEVDIREYRGIGIISGQNIISKSNSNSIATALISDRLLLLASDQDTLKNSLDISQLPEENQLSDVELNRSIQELDDGVALITVSSKTLHSLFSLPLKISDRKDFKGLIGSLKVNEKDIIFDGILQFNQPLETFTTNKDQSLSLLQAAGSRADGLAIVNSPSKLLDKSSQDPLVEWTRPFIHAELEKIQGLPAQTIAQSNPEAFLLIKEPDGWVLGTKKGNPPISLIDEELTRQELKKSTLIINNNTLITWSKLIVNSANKHDQIDINIGALLYEEDENNWWGQNIAALEQREEKGLEPREKLLSQIYKNNQRQPIILMSLNPIQAETLLTNWYPWRLIQSLTGQDITVIANGLELSIDSGWPVESSSINLRADLHIA